MGITTKPLKELLEKVDKEQLQLPEIQREFVWSKNSVKLLFDSLYRELPIGQMLVWKPTDTVPASKSFAYKKQKKSPTKIDAFYGYLLDGQQRLTALARVRDADENYPLQVSLWPEDEKNGTLFFWGQRDFGVWYLPMAEVLDPDFKVTAHLKELEEDADYKDVHAESVHSTLTRLRSILDYEISVIEFESDDHNKATELFIRFNSTGRKLNRNDLALADLATRVPGITSSEMGKVLNRWKPHFQFTRPFLIQCLAAVHTGRMNVQHPEEVWKDSTEEAIRESWRKTAYGLAQVVKLLTGTVHWDAGTWVPSFNALIPLVYIFSEKKMLSEADRILARRWLLLTGAHAYFSGSVYSQLDQLLRKLPGKKTVKQLWTVTQRRLRRLRPDDFTTTRRSSPMMSLLISMMRENNAKDWLGGTPLDGTVLGHNADLHVHHIFPKALLAKHGYGSSEINTLANFAIISADSNLEVGMEEPASYLTRLKVNEKHLEAQCIPTNPDLWQISRYEDFIKERRKLLAQRANEYLGL